MLKLLTILVCVLYLYDMEEKVCPICAKKGLVEISGKALLNRKRIVCENEYFKHLQFGDRHFLARTEKNVLEEMEQLVFN